MQRIGSVHPGNVRVLFVTRFFLGAIAIRDRGETLRWDSQRLTIPNSTTANDLLSKRCRKGWEPAWLS